LIEFIPYPVTIGFTAGIAVVIATLQIKDLLALEIPAMPEHFLERVGAIAAALPTMHWQDLSIGAGTLAVLLLWPRITRKLPGPLVALTLAAVAAHLLAQFVPGFDVVTIDDKFGRLVDGVKQHGIPQLPPMFVLPWDLPGAHGEQFALSWDVIRTLTPSAFAIAMLGAIESLLSAVVADGMIGTQHDPDSELFAQGVGNFVGPFFGGIAATGAIARTATNVRAGARSPISAIVHSVIVLASVIALAPLLGALPMAALAALLILVAWNMSEAKHFLHSLRTSPRSDTLVLMTCFSLTVVFDMVIAVGVGIVLASLLFLRRMAELAEVKLVEAHHPQTDRKLPKSVVIYEIAGPLFFGAAHRATRALHVVHDQAKTVVLDLESVPAMDATGVVNLRSAIARLHADHLLVVLAGLQPEPRRVLDDAGIVEAPGKLLIFSNMTDALDHVAPESDNTVPEQN
ncbi:MAG TPA: SulP family inorganic anion transporter, partial [Planctomycetota bacterium]|nr:SulP family inorganic anion transporter [Planctomycetota bacterium]